jgi:2-dehydro-3-deoxyphosphogluconate aldolase/(4S)-4-hydroxy-2-oxoglutarate aldolase
LDIDRFRRKPILGIIRGIRADEVEPVAEAIVSGGLESVEITMNTEGAPALIRKMVDRASGRFMVGAGTVLSTDELKLALDSGATFIVMPTLIRDVVELCVKKGIPVFPGALTPQEIYDAWQAGASMVKVFPAKVFGPEYFREVRGPFNNIKLLACAGVTPENMGEYFKNGASAVSFGASVFSRDLLDRKDFSTIQSRIRDYISRLP